MGWEKMLIDVLELVTNKKDLEYDQVKKSS